MLSGSSVNVGGCGESSGGGIRICISTNGGGGLNRGGGSVGVSSLLSGGSILLSSGSSSTRSLASHSPGSSHSGDASLRFASSPPVNTPLRYSTPPPVDALPHAAPHWLPYTQPETPPINVVSGDAHAPAAAVGEIGAVGAAVAAAEAVGAEAAGAGAAEAKAAAPASAAAPAAVGPGQSSGRWTQLEAALTMATPPAPWHHTLARPSSQPHVPSACKHSPPGSPSLGLAHSLDELAHARKPVQQQLLSQQQQQQQRQQQQLQVQQRTLCEAQCEGQQGQEGHGSSWGSSTGSSSMSSSRCAIRGGTDAPRCPDAPDSTDFPGVLLVPGALAGPAAVGSDPSSAAGDAGNQKPPVTATAAEGQLKPQFGEAQGVKGRTQPGSVAVIEGQSQQQLDDAEVNALGPPKAEKAAQESDTEVEGRAVEAEKGGEEVDGAVGRKKKKKKQKAKAGKRALKTNGSNASNGSTPCGGLSNSSSRSSGRVGDVASGVGCGSQGSNVSSGVGDGSRGSSRGVRAPAVVDAENGRDQRVDTCGISRGSGGSLGMGVGSKRSNTPPQGPPHGPLSSNTCAGSVSVVGQGPSANLANPIGRVSPSPGAAKGRSMSTGRGCGALQRSVRLDGTSNTLRHRGGGALHTASSSVHSSPARTSRRNAAFNNMPLPPLAATQLPSRNLQEHSAFHTLVASVTLRFGPGEPLVARWGGGCGGRGSVTGVMSQAEGEVGGREALDLREERRKAHERLEAYSKAKQAKAQEVRGYKRGGWGGGGGVHQGEAGQGAGGQCMDGGGKGSVGCRAYRGWRACGQPQMEEGPLPECCLLVPFSLALV